MTQDQPPEKKDPPLHQRLCSDRFTVHLTAFLLIMLASAGLYFAAQAQNSLLIWLLLGLVVLGNLLTIITR